MRDYRNFTASDFAKDESFQSWVHRPTEELDVFFRGFQLDHPEKIADILEAREILTSLTIAPYSMEAAEVTDLWKKIQKARMEAEQPVSVVSRVRWKWVAAAAVVAVAASALLLSPSEHEIASKTAFGETRTIVLPDSSTVILNANSRIHYSSNLETEEVREVRLEGEAYFSVVHTKAHTPFRVVTSDGVAVEVLGTSFNVYHREQTKVVLNSGKIQLQLPGEDDEQKIEMTPGDMVEYKESKVSKRVVDPKVYAAWTEKKIILDQTSLREMISTIRNTYGLEIDVQKESMLNQTVSGSMPLGDADSFVTNVARAFQLKVVKQNNRILFTE